MHFERRKIIFFPEEKCVPTLPKEFRPVTQNTLNFLFGIIKEFAAFIFNSDILLALVSSTSVDTLIKFEDKPLTRLVGLGHRRADTNKAYSNQKYNHTHMRLPVSTLQIWVPYIF